MLYIRGLQPKTREARYKPTAYSPPYEERTQAPVDSIEALWDRKGHLQGTGASTSLKSLAVTCTFIANNG